jgi:hypothetical protein
MHRAPIRRESNTLLSESREVEARRQPAGSMPGHCDEHVPSHRGSCTRCLPRNRPTRVRSDHTGRVKSIIVCMSLCFAVLPKASDSLAPPPHERVCPGAVEIPGTLPPAPLACAMPACLPACTSLLLSRSVDCDVQHACLLGWITRGNKRGVVSVCRWLPPWDPGSECRVRSCALGDTPRGMCRTIGCGR